MGALDLVACQKASAALVWPARKYGNSIILANTRRPGRLASTCREAAAINHCVVSHCVISHDQQAVGQLIGQTGEYFSPSTRVQPG